MRASLSVCVRVTGVPELSLMHRSINICAQHSCCLLACCRTRASKPLWLWSGSCAPRQDSPVWINPLIRLAYLVVTLNIPNALISHIGHSVLFQDVWRFHFIVWHHFWPLRFLIKNKLLCFFLQKYYTLQNMSRFWIRNGKRYVRTNYTNDWLKLKKNNYRDVFRVYIIRIRYNVVYICNSR